jgi:hypothetical protein
MIRPISSLYLVGQVHPRMQVKCPSADIKSKYSEQRLLVWLQRHLNQVPDGPAGRDEQYSVSLDMLTQARS